MGPNNSALTKPQGGTAVLLVAREAGVAPGPTGYRQQNILVHNCSDYSIALSRAGRLAINSAVSCYAARYSRTR